VSLSDRRPASTRRKVSTATKGLVRLAKERQRSAPAPKRPRRTTGVDHEPPSSPRPRKPPRCARLVRNCDITSAQRRLAGQRLVTRRSGSPDGLVDRPGVYIVGWGPMGVVRFSRPIRMPTSRRSGGTLPSLRRARGIGSSFGF
jgi:hypothetical protein